MGEQADSKLIQAEDIAELQDEQGTAGNKGKPPKKTAKKKPETKQNKGRKKPATNKSGSKRVGAKPKDGKKPPPKKQSEADPFEQARRRIRTSLPKIVDKLATKAEGGSCVHAKTLLEMTGAKHMFDGELQQTEKGEPWAKLVLEKLGEAESGGEEAAAEAVEAAPGEDAQG